MDLDAEKRLVAKAIVEEAMAGFPADPPELKEALSSLFVEALMSTPTGLWERKFGEILTPRTQERFKPEHLAIYREVTKLAQSNPVCALATARTIKEPWNRCQAICRIAESAQNDQTRNELIRESFAAAMNLMEPNRIVTASTWPLAVLCKHQQWPVVEAESRRLSALIATEPSPVRRGDALDWLCKTMHTAPKELARPVFEQFVDTCLTLLSDGRANKRGQSSLTWMLPVIYKHIDRDWALKLVDSIIGPTLHQCALRLVLEAESDTAKEHPQS